MNTQLDITGATPEITTFNFHGHQSAVLRRENGPHVSVTQLCNYMGIDGEGQRQNIERKHWSKGWTCVTKVQLPGDTQARTHFLIHERRLPMWLGGITTSRIKDEGVRAEVERHQIEFADALADYLTKGVAVNPRFTVPTRSVPQSFPEALRAYAEEIEAHEVTARRAKAGESFKTAIEAGDGLALRSFHKKYFSDVAERVFFEHLYAKGYLIDQRGRGEEREDGSVRDGAQHRHPGHKGKHFFYLHSAGVYGGKRRETTRVRPGEVELELKTRLIAEGLPANNNDTGPLALEA